MKFDIFAFFKKYPILAFVILSGLALYTGSKLTREAQIEGLIPGLQVMEATVIDSYSQEVSGRRGRTTEGCFVSARSEEGLHAVRIDCDDKTKYESGNSIELLKDGDSIGSLSFAKGHFYIDLCLFLAELFGVVYYFRLSRKKRQSL